MPALAFAAIALFCLVFRSGIGFGTWTLLKYPASVYIPLAAGALVLALSSARVVRYLRSRRNPHRIEIGERCFSFPDGKYGRIEIAFDDVEQMWNSQHDDGQRSIAIKTGSGKIYEFDEVKFAGSDEFEAWRSAMITSCPNATWK